MADDAWLPSCSLSFPELDPLVFSPPSPSPPSLFISFSTGRLIGPALLLALLPPDWLEGLWSKEGLAESSPRAFPPMAVLALLLWEEAAGGLLEPGLGPHWVSVLCSRPRWPSLGLGWWWCCWGPCCWGWGWPVCWEGDGADDWEEEE